MKLLFFITSFFLLSQYNVPNNDKLIGYWKVSKMESSEMTYDLENLDISRTAFFSKLKQAQTTAWTNADSLSADTGFNLGVDILKQMSITFKKGNLFSMTISKAISIIDGKYVFDKTSNDLIFKDGNDTLRYKVLSLSDSALVLINTDDEKSVITYKKHH